MKASALHVVRAPKPEPRSALELVSDAYRRTIKAALRALLEVDRSERQSRLMLLAGMMNTNAQFLAYQMIEVAGDEVAAQLKRELRL